jgi:hypothetical protein
VTTNELLSGGISPATIRLVLNQSRDARQISSHGSGLAARWRRLPAGQGSPTTAVKNRS